MINEFHFIQADDANYTNLNCINCGEVLIGRRDKKFCDDHCRSLHHNVFYAPKYNLIRKTHTTLRKNRRILVQASSFFGERIRVPVKWLTQRGFSFDHCTQFILQKNKKPQFVCYDIAYQWWDQEGVEIFFLPSEARAA